MDFAQARYYGNLIGRFISTDPLHASGIASDPQSWNRYSYVGNHPLTLSDPSGLIWAFNSKQNAYQWFENGLTDKDRAEGWEIVTSYTFYAGEWGYVALNPLRNEWRAGFFSRQSANRSVFTMLMEADPAGDYDDTSGSDEMGVYIGGVGGVGKMLLSRMLRAGGGILAKSFAPSVAEETISIYRGVNQSSPAFADGLKGVAKPRKNWWEFWRSSATPLEHNTVSAANSAFTSWTTDPAVALNFALRPNSGGVVLEMTLPVSKIVASPNLKSVSLFQGGGIVSEAEVLVKGVVSGAKVTKVP